MKKNRIILSLVLFLIIAPLCLSAREFFADESHVGELKLNDGLSIFPHNRVSNSIYLNRQLILSIEGQTIFDAAKIPSGFVYASINNEEEITLNYYLEPKTEYEIARRDLEGLLLQVKEKSAPILYYIKNNERITSINIPYRSAGGFSVHPSGSVAFFYINKFTGTAPNRVFTMTIGVYNQASNSIVIKPEQVNNTEAKLDFNWVDEKILGYSTVQQKDQKFIIK